eukprot:11827883-Alexandrium_andersonii.AAC.1
MEALFASCSEEFQNLKSIQAQVMSASESLKAEAASLDAKLKSLGNYIGQQLSNMSSRISILESRPTGVQSEFSGGPTRRARSLRLRAGPPLG